LALNKQNSVDQEGKQIEAIINEPFESYWTGEQDDEKTAKKKMVAKQK